MLDHLDAGQIGGRLDHAVEHVLAGLRVGDLAAAEHHGEAHLVARLEEAPDMLHLEVHVVALGLGAELDLFDLDRRRVLAGLLLLLGLLVLVLAVIHDPAHRREGARRDLDEIQALLLGDPDRLVGRQDAELLATVFDDDSHLGDADAVVDAQAALGTAAIVTTRGTTVHGQTLGRVIGILRRTYAASPRGHGSTPDHPPSVQCQRQPRHAETWSPRGCDTVSTGAGPACGTIARCAG